MHLRMGKACNGASGVLLQIESDEDVLWKPDVRETDEQIGARGRRLMAWLMQRPESVIALVSHSGFLRCTSRCFGLDAAAGVRDEMHRK